MSSIAMLADTISMHFLRTHPRGDPRVVRGFFMAVDSSVEIEVQVSMTKFPVYMSCYLSELVGTHAAVSTLLLCV